MSGTRRRPGRLGPFVDGYRCWLLARGYTPQTCRLMLRDLSRLGRWMDANDVESGGLTLGLVERWLEERRAADGYRVPTVRTLRSLLVFLGEAGVLAVEPSPVLSPFEGLIGAYRDWMLAERDLAAMTIIRYERTARQFLGSRVTGGDRLGVAGLDGVVVARFLLRECGRVSVGSAKGRVAELRSLLRFLHARGLTDRPLADAIPGVAGWRDTQVPATMSQSDVEALLASAGPGTLDGARDRAMMLLAARLGLRSVEIARLTLDDIDWQAGDLLVRGKARRDDRLPLPVDVGEALAAYLRLRGASEIRDVFLTLKAPSRSIRADLVGDVVQRHCLKAGIGHVGKHRLRHTLASRMLAGGRRSRRSARCCATATWLRQRPTQRSMSAGFANLHGRGRGWRDERARRLSAGLPGAAFLAGTQARGRAPAAATVRRLSRRA